MHLKSLTLRGFKSFAQPTTFQFEPGVTAIVGPNGSGKSNVVDALAWVMGEQGAKTLRGGKMEDVIFAGTSTRGPLGRAEVRLTIDNSDGALPIEYTEVTISRILFRNGSSEYAINGESCRLLDVQELLSDSGLGREMHVIVGQGQLDTVLRATPEDRRGFIEEAAGILKHRRRKERTLRKLDAMETNLTRLNDLAGEIRRQLKPLGRQAEVARQAQTIAAEVRDAKARLLADDVTRLRAELASLAKDESERHSERIVLQEQVEQKQLRIERLEQEQQGDELDAARRVTFGLESAQSKLRGLYAQAQQRLTFLATQSESPEQVSLTSRAAVDESREEAHELAARIPEHEDRWRATEQATRKAQQTLDAIDEQIQAQAELVSRHDLELSALRGRLEAAEQKRETIAAELERRTQALTQAETRATDAQAELEAFEAEADGAELPEGGLDGAYRAAQERENAAEKLVDEQRSALHALEQEAAGLEARVSALARSLDQRDASGALLAEQPEGVRGRVADHVKVRDGYEAAVGAALGLFADALLVESADIAQRAVSDARHRDIGRLRAVIANAADSTGPDLDVPGLLPIATVLVEAPDGVRGLLSRSYVADDAAQAIAGATILRAKLPGGGFTIVTAEGDVVTEHTLAGGSGLAPSRIELTADLAEAEGRLADIAAEIETAAAALADQREQVARLKAESKAAYAELREADARLAEHARRRQQLVVRAEATRSEAERAATALAGVTGSEDEAADLVIQATRALEEAAAKPRPILDASQRDALLADVDRARSVEIEARLAFETAKERARAAEERSVALANQFEAERRAAEEAARRAVLRSRQVARAEHVAEALPGILDACDRSLSEARTAQQVAEQERARNSQELTLLRSEESEARGKLQSITELVHGAELKSYERKLQLSSLLERAGNELGLVEDVLVAEYGPEIGIPVAGEDDVAAPASRRPETLAAASEARGELSLEEQLAIELGLTATGAADGGDGDTEDADGSGVDADADRADADDDAGATPQRIADSQRAQQTVPFVRVEQERRLAKAERRLSELGRINPLALEEFAALEQRHKFLVDQLADLTKTRADLRQIIEELDEHMQGIFAAAFEDTRAAFAEVFPILFPGGSGEISLTNPDELLTTGIDIAVRPAGKKVERLSLLSGGERSLAAVALLVAIFQARPSPFYIMDEVEAALDDANLGRLLQVFERLRETSQLIVITHQKRTMEIADALYGVSMRRDGISAVVGQRLGAEV
ncbi:AAA family ATPase [Leucobacter aridicollis]|uniref:Chromosome partition protein Smc n=1 Tax=Leucobacter aridicollis TaxID=283878 RepID=A0A852RC98_9MICO|nr:AAA family ATPase [Leucobacter aridicollis]MBL3681948.1 chromosome segregation protein SMC [Leucobacter aridicollis]NYD27006.1 chromosome segregation protein [Leucobacter aridicollis]